MQINRDNYECFFIDFIDGKLSPSEEEALRAFAYENPDLAEELSNLDKMVLKPSLDLFSDKACLLHLPNFAGIESRTDYLCIAKVEKDITPEEENELLSIVESANTLDLYKKLVLLPPKYKTYIHKAKLKRYSLFALNYKHIIAISSSAAVALILFGLFTFFQKSVSVVPELAVYEHEQPLIEFEKPENSIPEYPKLPYTESKPNRINQNFQSEQKLSADLELSGNESNEIQIERDEISANRIPRIELVDFPLPYSGQPASEFLAFARFERNELGFDIIDERPQSGTREIGFFELAQMGLNRLAAFTGRDVNLGAEKDIDGRITKINFESELFALSVPVSKKKQ